ncbi:MAG: hypothetical protein PF439_11675 [Helicobacteraceae bacterium]|jgi:uncharacterized protein YcfJ|nr:hypothetical protein [Helicobacteraceae bacterium]
MKTLLLAVALILSTSAIANGTHNGYQNKNGRYNDVHAVHNIYKKKNRRFVKVAESRPIYKEVITYRECHNDPHRIERHEGALIGGIVGGIIGNNLASKHKLPHTIGGAVTGAIIGANLNRHRQRRAQYCEYAEQQLVGYKNIAYWRGKKIVRISDKPLHKIHVDRKKRDNDHRYVNGKGTITL